MASGASYAAMLLLLIASYSTLATAKDPSDDVIVVLFEPESAFGAAVEGNSYEIMWFTNSTLDIHSVEINCTSKENSEVVHYSQPISVLGDPPERVNSSHLDGRITFFGTMNITAVFLGFNDIHMHFFDIDNNSLGHVKKEQSVLLPTQSQLLTTIFTYSAAVITGILYFFMGATLDLEIVKGIFKKPVGPALGLICQYGVMPSVAFGLGFLFFPDDYNLRLGLFLNGCCPGGGQSNMWTHLLGGSLDLSVMMTCVSTIAAFGAVPMWVLTVGPIIVAEADFEIPFLDIVITVVSLIFPCIIGIVVQVFFPKIIKYAKKVLTPFSIFILVFVFTFGVYSYLYTFSLMTVKSVFAGFMLPFLGYLIGITLGKICRQSWKNAIAIGIETGVQNATITIIILAIAIPEPTSSIATVIPATNTLFTPLPLFVAYLVKLAYMKMVAERKVDITSTSLKNNSTKEAEAEAHTQANGITNPAADLRDVL